MTEAEVGRIALGELDAIGFSDRVRELVAGGARLADLVARRRGGRWVLRALLASKEGFSVVETELAENATRVPSLSSFHPAARWFERVVCDTTGLEGDQVGLDPLVAPPVDAVMSATGEGVFVLPYGPVRSGVFESVEWDLETIGEDIVAVGVRLHHKRRGIEQAAVGRRVEELSIVAERVEGVASVAHALAASEAVERLAGVEVPEAARWARLAHLELERLANHVDSMARHAEAAGQAVALARLGVAKEELMRLRARWSGHRFARGVVVPGGVREPVGAVSEVRRRLAALVGELWRDISLLMVTPSFLDRLRRTGILRPEVVAERGGLGPVGRGSGRQSDARVHRPSGAYRWAAPKEVVALDGDALARQQVRVGEVIEAAGLADRAFDELERAGGDLGGEATWRVPMGNVPDGLGVGWAEAAQGEVVAMVEVEDGRLSSFSSTSASFVNLALFPFAFGGDIFTDFAFIEASFGLSIAGAAR
jgi:formate hydrogenlyase subunit 5